MEYSIKMNSILVIILIMITLCNYTRCSCVETLYPMGEYDRIMECTIENPEDFEDEGLLLETAIKFLFTNNHTVDFTRISQSFPNLEYLAIDMTYLTSSQLRECLFVLSLPKLLSLTVSKDLDVSNDVIYLVDYTFTPQSHIETLILRGIGIGELDRHCFFGLSKLKELDLRQNYIQEVEPGVFEDCTNLKILRFQENFLESGYLSPGFLTGPESLQWLSFEDNPLGSLPEALFSQQRNLSALFLSKTDLQFVHPKAFEGNTELKHINLANNKLPAISSEAFTPLTKLFSLDLSYNDLNTGLRPGSFSPLTSLEILYLQYTNLQEIAPGSFHGLIKLRELHLRGNQLKELNGTAFQQLAGLEYLDLSENHITSITPGTFNHSPLLKTIQLAGNLLQSLVLGVFDSITPELLYFQDNRWNCTCNLLWLFQYIESNKATLSNEAELYKIKCSSPESLKAYDFYSLRFPHVMGCEDQAVTSEAPLVIDQITNGNMDYNSGLSQQQTAGMIAGIVIACLAVIIAAMLVCVYLWRKKKYRLWQPAQRKQHAHERQRTPSWCIDQPPQRQLPVPSDNSNGHLTKPPDDNFMFDNEALETSVTSKNTLSQRFNGVQNGGSLSLLQNDGVHHSDNNTVDNSLDVVIRPESTVFTDHVDDVSDNASQPDRTEHSNDLDVFVPAR